MKALACSGLLLITIALLITLTPKVFIFQTHGTSMGQLIPNGSTVHCLESQDYYVGDLVVYYNPWWDTRALHRIIYKEQDQYLMQGDNETSMDAGVMFKEHIICKVVKIMEANDESKNN